jgi:hypothetical protein
MPRNAVLRKPIRLHLNLEKETLQRLRKLARGRATSVTEILRGLAESYAAGRLRPITQEPLGDVVKRINALRFRSARVSTSSEHLLRQFRDARA